MINNLFDGVNARRISRQSAAIWLKAVCICAVAIPIAAQAQTTVTYNNGDNNATAYNTSAPNDPTTLTISSGSASQSGDLSGTGRVFKTGAGALTLSGTNTYTGGTTLNSGRLNIGNNSALGTGDLIINGGTISNDGTFRTITNNVVANSSFVVESGGASGDFEIGGLDIAGPGITIDSTGSGGQADLLVSGAVTGSGGVSYTASQGNFRTVDYQGTVANTLTGTTTVGNQVLLGLSKSGVNAIAGDLTIDAGGRVDTFSGNQIDDNATVTVNGFFSFNPGASETIGTLNGSGSGVVEYTTLITVSSTLTVKDGNYAGTFDVLREFQLIKQSTGTLTLSGDSSSSWNSGFAQVDQGTLLINGNVPVPVTVNADGILGGTGTVGGNTTINNDGILSPGTSPGTTTFGSDLILNSGSILDYELDTPGTVGSGVNDLIVVNGNLTLDGVLNITNLGGFATGSYTLIQTTGTITDNGLDIGSLPAGFVGSIEVTANAVVLNAQALVPAVGLSRSAIDFSTVRVGETSGTQNVTITNTGTAALTLGSLTISGSQASEFGIDVDNCSGQTLAVDVPCSVSIVFSPTAKDARSAQLNIPSNAANSPDSVGLSGTGVQSEVSVSLLPADFGEVRVGETSSPLTVTLTNNGSATLNVSALTAAAAPFAQTDAGTCGAAPFSVDAGTSCTLTYTFSPTADEPASQSFTVTSDAESGGNTFELAGTGIESVVSLTLDTLNFGMLPPGESSQQILTITNNGEADLNLFEITDPGSPFAIVAGEPQGGIQPCAAPSVLVPGASCTITVEFAPQTPRGGSFEASFEIRSDAANSPTTITLRASAEAIPIPILNHNGLLLLILGMLFVGLLAFRPELVSK